MSGLTQGFFDDVSIVIVILKNKHQSFESHFNLTDIGGLNVSGFQTFMYCLKMSAAAGMSTMS